MSLPRLPFPVNAVTPVSGGSLSAAYRVELADGRTGFVKTAGDAAPGAFEAEAAGLDWIRAVEGSPPVPEVLAVGPEFLALSWIASATRDDEQLGRGLAALHRAGAPAFGALPPGIEGGLRIGPLRLPVSEAASWIEVYRDQMVIELTRRAAEQGTLGASGVTAVEQVCARIEQLAGPPEAPARLHGDLWGGNAVGNHLIDPAAYGGHREIDLAMMRLFGGFGPRCFAAYEAAFPLADGAAGRVALWQLLPLLIHTVLFGGGYGAEVEAAARAALGSG